MSADRYAESLALLAHAEGGEDGVPLLIVDWRVGCGCMECDARAVEAAAERGE